MSSDELVLASLLVSRLMHDLAASAGAVGNGIEMLREESGKGGVDAGALDLLEFSARETLRRLEFFRLAFGAAGGLGSRQPLDEARAKVTAFFEGRKVKVDWPRGTAADAPQPVVKLTLSLVMICAEALPRGGTVSVALEDRRVEVTAAGRGRLSPRKGRWRCPAMPQRSTHAWCSRITRAPWRARSVAPSSPRPPPIGWC